jgi:hypothetical protein
VVGGGAGDGGKSLLIASLSMVVLREEGEGGEGGMRKGCFHHRMRTRFPVKLTSFKLIFRERSISLCDCVWFMVDG